MNYRKPYLAVNNLKSFMAADPNRLSNFWQELKRRNVSRVVAVYIAAAFMILELVDMIAEPFGLPGWSMKVAFFILLAGLIITAVVSWIYDIRPKEGIVKTEPADKIKPEDIPKSSSGWKIASYISFVVIVALIVLNIIPRTGQSEILDKSIAVLPFISLSDDPDKQYQADGVMDAILLHLSKIEELRVMARTSVEQYRGTSKTAADICEELNVAYVLEGSFQKYGDQARLIVQLIRSGSGEHVWANNYDREWKDIFAVQSEVAQKVAGELQAVITPELKQRIEEAPTSDLTAYDYYLRGLETYSKFNLINGDQESLISAQNFFNQALEYDSTLAPAYAGLARVYYDLNRFGEGYFSEDYLDTVLILANKALSFDPQLSEAYSIMGGYYSERDRDLALSSYDRALELNPNDWSVYWGKANMYYNDDLLTAIENIHQAMLRYQGPVLQEMLYLLGYQYQAAGFMDKGDSIFLELLKETGDSSMFYIEAQREFILGNPEGELAIYEDEIRSANDSVDPLRYFSLGRLYSETGQYEKAVEFMDKHIEWINESGGRLSPPHRIGYAYWMAGDMEKGAYYLNMQKEMSENAIKLERRWARNLYDNYDLAGVYAFLGEREKAYENLRIFNQRERMTLQFASLIKIDPLFDSIRDEPEFQQIVSDVEAKYQAEHERVRQWLEENNML